ncbi:acyl-coenzyme A amino acid N-acyltransferase 1-like [Spea bombifrons]|uniref:acyl-coenzyme A amino acid N-acyltransferase 1-like n=1 Tax=Spea bombifrons TaxID=233779 RepID=UPI00234BEF1C|nr:acyl-coenzyme A amino acid N-acyltransferase 1-like [Spea bombifrons]
MVVLNVFPDVGMADECVQITATGLKPLQPVTIRLTLQDDKGEFFQSRAFYKANARGEVNLERDSAVGGTYCGVEPMGLIWSLKPLKPFKRPVKTAIKDSPFRYTIDLFDSLQIGVTADSQPTITKKFERWFMSLETQKITIKDGRIRGTLFIPSGKGPFPGVIDMYGGAGGLVEYRASLLANHGFVVLALAFFAYDDLPRSFHKLDLEYFEDAAELLLSNPKVAGPKVGVLGVSKGAEIALMMSSFLPQIGATVSINGTCNLYGSTFYYKGKPILKGTNYNQEKMMITEEGLMCTTGLYDENSDSCIPVENASGQILFVAGEADQYYNSTYFAEKAMARMKKYLKTNGRLMSMPGAGHLIEPPGFPFCWASDLRGNRLPVLWGGEMFPHCLAQDFIWKECRSFLLKHLNQASKL